MRSNFFYLSVCLCLTMRIVSAEEEESLLWTMVYGIKFCMTKGVQHFKAVGRGEQAIKDCDKKDAEIDKLRTANGNNGDLAKLKEEFKATVAVKDVEIDALKQRRMKDVLSGVGIGLASAGAGYGIYHIFRTRYYPTRQELDLRERAQEEETVKNTFWENKTKLRTCIRNNAHIENGKFEIPLQCKELSNLFTQEMLDEIMQLYNRKY